MGKLLVILSISVIAFSCKNKSAESSQVSTVNEKPALAAVSAKGKYSVKSGVVDYKIEMMGMTGTQTLYFDDYGNTESNLIVLDVMGTKSQTLTITKDGTVYNINPAAKTGSKAPVMVRGNVNFENLTDDVIKEWNLKREGKESILGRECERFSMDNESMGMKGYYWVWKGIALKVNATVASVKMVLDATAVQDNVAIPAEKFEVPADIVFN